MTETVIAQNIPSSQTIGTWSPVRTSLTRPKPVTQKSPRFIPKYNPRIYARLFWRPFLGNSAFALWDILKALDLDQDGRVEIPVTIQELAALMGVGDRYTILGRNATKSRKAQAGVLDQLVAAGLVSYTTEGPDPYHQRFHFLVTHRPPILTEDQVETLNKKAQDFHRNFIGEQNLTRYWNGE